MTEKYQLITFVTRVWMKKLFSKFYKENKFEFKYVEESRNYSICHSESKIPNNAIKHIPLSKHSCYLISYTNSFTVHL